MPRCKLENCPVARDGRCLEGRGSDCPNLVPDDRGEPNAENLSDDMPPSLDVAYEPLRSGLTLEVQDAREITRRGRAIVVTLVGLKDSGKTCLIARLHQLFQHGPMGEFDFAGSRTLPHFEEINWKSTVASGLEKAEMDRTSAQFDNRFVHFAVKHLRGSFRQDLLINDVSGETYRNAVSSKIVCESLVSISRADHLCLVIDGATLAAGTGHSQLSKARDFVQRAIQNGQIGAWTAVQLIFSKSDTMKGQAGQVAEIVGQFKDSFANQVGSFTQWCLAARPEDHTALTIPVIQEMFSYWLTVTHRYQGAEIPVDRRQDWPREFCRFRLES